MTVLGRIISGIVKLKPVKIGDWSGKGGDHGLKDIFKTGMDAYKTRTNSNQQRPLDPNKMIILPGTDVEFVEHFVPEKGIFGNLPYYLLVIPAIAAAACFVAYQILMLIFCVHTMATRFRLIIYGAKLSIR